MEGDVEISAMRQIPVQVLKFVRWSCAMRENIAYRIATVWRSGSAMQVPVMRLVKGMRAVTSSRSAGEMVIAGSQLNVHATKPA